MVLVLDGVLHISTDDNMYLYAPTSCVITSPSTNLTGSLACTNITCNSIQVIPSQQPPSAYYIGYSNITQLSTNYTLAWGTYNNLLSTTISTPGVYDIDAQIAYSYTTGYTNDNVCTYGISLSPTTTDINCFYCQYTAGHLNINYSTYSGVQNLTYRRILYVSSSTTVYLICYFSGGTNNSASANVYTYLRYTRIA